VSWAERQDFGRGKAFVGNRPTAFEENGEQIAHPLRVPASRVDPPPGHAAAGSGVLANGASESRSQVRVLAERIRKEDDREFALVRRDRRLSHRRPFPPFRP
jgi:hypothetical protein